MVVSNPFVSNDVIGAMPDLPAVNPAQLDAVSSPNGVTMPMPVT